MLLSTSSSKVRSNQWLLTWVITIAVLLLSLGIYESYLKQQGFVASIENDKNLWSWYRGHIYHQKQIVLIGASRNQIDINTSYLHDKYPEYHVAQLSINGHYPMATLKALADDEAFEGIVIVSLNAQVLETKYLAMQEHYNSYYKNESTLYKSLDAYLMAFIQSYVRMLHPSLGFEQVVKFYQHHKRFPDVFYTSANLDQSITTDYSKTDIATLLKHFVTQKQANYINDPPTKPELWKSNIELLINYTRLIKKRGGQVVLVRFPTDKGHWQLDEEYYPRSDYWNKIAQEPLLNTIHFKDIPGLDQFDLPDSSHLDSRDSREFTMMLFNKIMQ